MRPGRLGGASRIELSRSFSQVFSLLALTAILAACASTPPPAPPATVAAAPPPRAAPRPPAAAAPAPRAAAAPPSAATRSLYDRLGGRPAITAVIDEFIARVAADKRI